MKVTMHMDDDELCNERGPVSRIRGVSLFGRARRPQPKDSPLNFGKGPSKSGYAKNAFLNSCKCISPGKRANGPWHQTRFFSERWKLRVNCRARGGRRQLPKTKRGRSTAGAPSAGRRVRPRKPSRCSRQRSAQPRLVHVQTWSGSSCWIMVW